MFKRSSGRTLGWEPTCLRFGFGVCFCFCCHYGSLCVCARACLSFFYPVLPYLCDLCLLFYVTFYNWQTFLAIYYSHCIFCSTPLMGIYNILAFMMISERCYASPCKLNLRTHILFQVYAQMGA